MATALEVLYANPNPKFRNENTWLSLEDTRQDKRFKSTYKKTYDFPGDYIDGYHRALANAPLHDPGTAHGCINIGFEGWLFHADALKLYELAYFNPDILEVGTYRGLSSAIMSHAITNSGRQGQIMTVDLDPSHQELARQAHEIRLVPNRDSVSFHHSEGAAFVRSLLDRREPRRFPLVFVDHSHAYGPMVDICPLIADVVAPGGFAIFHDYNDPRNPDTGPGGMDFEVYQAVDEYLSRDKFDFYGIFGVCGLFRRKG